MQAAAQDDTPGTVVTFYSYKGGTGRSMALANTACTLSWQLPPEQQVLVVDWDLEAPGLHRFFPPRLRRGRPLLQGLGLGAEPGLIDLLRDLAQALPAELPADEQAAEALARRALDGLDLDRYIERTEYPQVWLLRAGRDDDGEYSRRVNTFSWESLFERAPMIYRLLAQSWAQRFRWVLVDSRTGVTDISGICTSLLPDKLVVVFTPNRQSLSGVRELVSRALSYRRASDDLRPLTVYPLPSRIEASLDDQRRDWRKGNLENGIVGFQPVFEELFRECYGLPDCSLDDYFDDVQIQQTPDCAYGEVISVRQEGGDRFSLASSYREFVRRLTAAQPPWGHARVPPAAAEAPAGPHVQDDAADRTAQPATSAAGDAGVAGAAGAANAAGPAPGATANSPPMAGPAAAPLPVEAAPVAAPPSPAGMEAGRQRVFLSYASDDRRRIEPLAQRLMTEGFEVFWDRERLLTGASWSREIEAALDAADVVVVFWSRAAVQSEWVLSEATEAARRSVILPVLLDEVTPPLAFRVYHTLAWSSQRPEDQQHLVAAVREVASRRPGQASLPMPAAPSPYPPAYPPAYAPGPAPAGGSTGQAIPAGGRRLLLPLLLVILVLLGALFWSWFRVSAPAQNLPDPAASHPTISGVPASVPLQTLVVAEVLGLDSNEARTRLEKAGLVTRMLRAGSTDEQDWIDGVVTQQLPAAGTVVVAGTRVKLTVETRTVAMPDLLGKPLAEATLQLNKLGLRRSEEIAQVVNLKVRAGIVLGQSVPAGQRMAVGATVQLRVASAPKVKEAPDKAP